jgi:hypothetical protein
MDSANDHQFVILSERPHFRWRVAFFSQLRAGNLLRRSDEDDSTDRDEWLVGKLNIEIVMDSEPSWSKSRAQCVLHPFFTVTRCPTGHLRTRLRGCQSGMKIYIKNVSLELIVGGRWMTSKSDHIKGAIFSPHPNDSFCRCNLFYWFSEQKRRDLFSEKSQQSVRERVSGPWGQKNRARSRLSGLGNHKLLAQDDIEADNSF